MEQKCKKKLIFFHLPKTGGTSVSHHFKNYFDQNNIFQQTGFEKIEDMSDCQKADCELISGHFSPATYIDDFRNDWISCLLLRNPLEHLRSNFLHIQTKGSGAELYDPDIVQLALRYPFSEFLFKSNTVYFTKLFDNPQIRFILNLEDEEITSAHYEAAVSTIKKISVVGRTENMNAFVYAVQKQLGVDTSGTHIPRIRTSYSKNSIYDLDQTSILSILRRSVYDMKLYQCVFQNIIDPRTADEAVDIAEVSLEQFDARSDCINLFDHVLSPSTRVDNATLGVEVMVEMTDIIMHPPLSNSGKSKLTIRNIFLDGHNIFSSRVSVPATDGPVVIFEFRVLNNEIIIADHRIEVLGGGDVPFVAVFSECYGFHDIILETSVPAGMSVNNGHARFINPVIRRPSVEKLS